MKWAEMDDKERVRLILLYVLKWPHYAGFDSFHAALWITGKWESVGYPVALWSEDHEYWSVFYHKDEDGCPFDPLHSMDAAWLVVEKVVHNPQVNRAQFKHWFDDTALWSLSAEKAASMICFMALKSVYSVDIE